MISVLCPTRGRMKMAREMIVSVRNTTLGDGEQVEILLWCDDDDDAPYEGLAGPSVNHRVTVRVFRGAIRSVGVAWNQLARMARGSLLMMGNDDLYWQTYGWNLKVTEEYAMAFPDGVGILWCDDGSGRCPMPCTFPVLSRRWYDVLGRFTPECFSFLWHDTWIHDVARRLDRAMYLPSVVIEHRHFALKGKPMDATAARHRVGEEAQARRAFDAEAYTQTAPDRQAEADALEEWFGRRWRP